MMRKIIKHIWRYLTDEDYRYKMKLTDFNRKYIKSHRKRFKELLEEQPTHYIKT